MTTPSAVSEPASAKLTPIEKFTIGTLCYINVINYLDRYCVAGVLLHIQKDFSIGDDLAGLLQTGFIFAYMVFSPVIGYMGDRYSRRMILLLCIVFWMMMTTAGSCATNYHFFFATRALVGIGEAGFTTIAPAVLSDIVSKDARSTALAYFYTAIPFGAGIGYVLGAKIAQWTGNWRWGLRATPIFGMIGILCLYLGDDPIRGEKEAAAIGGRPAASTSYKEDLIYLIKNRSFVLSTSASTCVCFVSGCLGWWAPKCLVYGFKIIPGNDHVEQGTVFLKFGLITSLTGVFGVSIGSFLSRRLRKSWPSIDPIICGLGLLLSLPFIIGALILCVYHELATLICLTIGVLALNLNWAVVIDILLYIVTPQRRSSAGAIQMLVSHALGDCFSPYIVGVMSEHYKKIVVLSGTDLDRRIVYALQRSLMTVVALQFLGAVLFLINARYVEWDRTQAERLLVVA